jgi:hypothetical protein
MTSYWGEGFEHGFTSKEVSILHVFYITNRDGEKTGHEYNEEVFTKMIDEIREIHAGKIISHKGLDLNRLWLLIYC